jgi:hypothetical protein
LAAFIICPTQAGGNRRRASADGAAVSIFQQAQHVKVEIDRLALDIVC